MDTQEVKTIFGPILPIYSLHRRMLRDLFQLLENWNDENLIGQIYVKYVSFILSLPYSFNRTFVRWYYTTNHIKLKNLQAKDLRKSYEPFINFFESVKNEITRCETEKPRFMAFLKIAQCKFGICLYLYVM